MKKMSAEWIQKAEGDYRVAARESAAPDAVCDAVCFHCHQCVEKYLKAVLIEHDVDFEKIHDLEALMYVCKPFTPGLEKHREGLIWLTQFSVRVRYPGFRARKSDAKKALSITRQLRSLIRDLLSLERKET
jgi:HEPN domain-containing protein